MPILGVLFDLGGTLLDVTDPIGWSEIARALGLPVEPDHFAHAVREVEAAHDRPDDATTEGAFWAEALARSTERAVAPPLGVEFLARWRSSAFQPALFSDARYCLERLQTEGIAMGIVSNSENRERVEGHLQRTGIARFFGPIVSSGTEGVRKPDPRIFRIGADRLRLKPTEIVFVGDLAYTDARAASAAGLHGVWLNRYGWGFGDDPPELTSLTEVPGYVRGIGEGPR